MTRAERAADARLSPGPPTAAQFTFEIEDKLTCVESGRVKYSVRKDNVLSLGIPLDQATNKESVDAFKNRELKRQKTESDEVEEVVRPEVPFRPCVDAVRWRRNRRRFLQHRPQTQIDSVKGRAHQDDAKLSRRSAQTILRRRGLDAEEDGRIGGRRPRRFPSNTCVAADYNPAKSSSKRTIPPPPPRNRRSSNRMPPS